jgi:hypothetical protein
VSGEGSSHLHTFLRFAFARYAVYRLVRWLPVYLCFLCSLITHWSFIYILNTLVEALVDDSSAAAELELTAVPIEVSVRIVVLHLGHVRSQATRRVTLRTFWDKHTT